MTDQLRIPADGTISFEIKGHEAELPGCASDANWLKALVTVSSATLSASVDAFITTSDLHGFLVELKDGLSGSKQKATFATDEGAIHIEITIGGSNQCEISGYLKEIGNVKAITTFVLKIDKGSLCRVVENLESLVELYPVITDDPPSLRR